MPNYLVALSLLTALCQCPKTNYKGLIESIHSNYLPTSSSGMYSLPAAEDMSTYDCQKRTLFSDNANLKMSKEHTAVFYVTPHLVENNSRLFFRSPSSEESGVTAETLIFTI